MTWQSTRHTSHVVCTHRVNQRVIMLARVRRSWLGRSCGLCARSLVVAHHQPHAPPMCCVCTVEGEGGSKLELPSSAVVKNSLMMYNSASSSRRYFLLKQTYLLAAGAAQSLGGRVGGWSAGGELAEQ